jgi:superfamily I DNA and/or RNA helicase
VSPYRAQLRVIYHLLRRDRLEEVEAMTVDRYQGRDKHVILISFVRNNEEKQVGFTVTENSNVDLLKPLQILIYRPFCSTCL